MKLYWANWALRIFLLRRQPESKSASAMKPASVNCLHTWKKKQQSQINIHVIVVDCGQDVEVEDLPSWRNPHRRGWQVLTSPDVERSTEAWWEDRHRCAGVKIMTNTRWEKKGTTGAKSLQHVEIIPENKLDILWQKKYYQYTWIVLHSNKLITSLKKTKIQAFGFLVIFPLIFL